MDIVSQIIKFIFRIRYWLVILPAAVSLLTIYSTRNLQRTYNVSTTIYTGIASGYDILSTEGGRLDWSAVNNSVDNLINIIKARTTLRNVSIRLYAQSMIYGDSINDNTFIQAKNYRHLVRITPRDVRKLIDKSSIDKTIENLNEYEKADSKNFVYGLFNWFHPHYSYDALSKIGVRRLSNSDMIEITYSANDPGIAYQTLLLLNREFINQYQDLRYGQTNNVIAYFREELERLGRQLKASEDSLTNYNVEKKIINYPEQSKIVAALSRDQELRYEEILLNYSSSSVLVKDLENKVAEQTLQIRNNTEFIEKLKKISQLSSEVAKLESFQRDSLATNYDVLIEMKHKLSMAEADLRKFSDNVGNQKFTKEGIALSTFVDQWLNEIIKREKSKAELDIMEQRMRDLDKQYVYFSPIGTTLKRKEREIDFTEKSYMNFLSNLNAALARQKNLQMTSATLKPLNPPLFPINPIPTARKMMVIISFVGTVFFVIGFFLFLEIFDRTVRDKFRAERLIPANVLGAFPKPASLRYRAYNDENIRIATNYFANALIYFLNPKERPDIINFISTVDDTGKSFLIENLKEYWEERGLRVRVLSWHDELVNDSRDFILSTRLNDLYDYENEDVILVEHRAITKSSIPVGLLKEASVNIVTVRADKVWRDIDKLSFSRIKENSGDAPVVLYLTQSARDVAEGFVGMLPPYSKLRNFVYNLVQFGLTSK